MKDENICAGVGNFPTGYDLDDGKAVGLCGTCARVVPVDYIAGRFGRRLVPHDAGTRQEVYKRHWNEKNLPSVYPRGYLTPSGARTTMTPEEVERWERQQSNNT